MNKYRIAIGIAIIIIVSLIYRKISNSKNLAEIVANSTIVDYKTALPESGLILATGYVSAMNPPQIPNIDIYTDSTIALIVNVEVYQNKFTTTLRRRHKYTPNSYDYDNQMAWCNNDLIDNDIYGYEDTECDGKMPDDYKAQIYIGSGFKFRDSIDLDQLAFTDDLNKVLKNQYSKSVIEYDYYWTEYMDTNRFTIMEFNPPNINDRKIFKVYNWIGANEFNDVYKKIDGYTSYFNKYGSVELGETIEKNPELENNANFKRMENYRYFHYYFYGNDPNKPHSGDIRIQVLAIESKNRHSIHKLIGVAADNMLKPFNDHYVFNADTNKFNHIIHSFKR